MPSPEQGTVPCDHKQSSLVEDSAFSNELVFYLNGRKVVETDVHPEMTLLAYLRSKKIGLTGTKLGCGEGGCGACTVMISSFDHTTKHISHRAINACLAPLPSVAGCHVITVEGIGSTSSGLHPVQQRMADLHGAQCGFCTPGIVMAMYTFFRNHPKATKAEVEEAMDGNLCRCTGYRPILDAAKSLASDNASPCGLGSQCCRVQDKGSSCGGGDAAPANTDSKSNGTAEVKHQHKEDEDTGVVDTQLPFKEVKVGLVELQNKDVFDHKNLCNYKSCSCKKSGSLPAYSGDSELVFPAFLAKYTAPPQRFVSPVCVWYTPTSLAQLLALKTKFPHAKLVVGNTEVGIETKFKNLQYPVRIYVGRVPELLELKFTEDSVHLGASTTLTTIKTQFEHVLPTLSEEKKEIVKAVLQQLRWFSSTQIRNAACLAGNLVTASPIADMNPVLQALNAVLRFQGPDGARDVPINKFFLNYRQVDIKPGEVLVCVTVPYPKRFEYIQPYKQARRREDDIAIVSAGMRVRLQPTSEAVPGQARSWTVQDCSLSFGGMAKTTCLAAKTQEFLIGKSWDEKTMQAAYKLLAEDLPLGPDTPGGMPQYRSALAASFLFKFFLYVNTRIGAEDNVDLVPAKLKSVVEPYHRPISAGVQSYQTNPNIPVNNDHQHVAAQLHVTGEAKYTDDIPDPQGTLHAALVLSTKAHAEILEIDTSEAEKVPGFVRYFSDKDIPGTNHVGDIFHDEHLFWTSKVTSQGQAIGLVVAENIAAAQRAAGLVKVIYKELPAIISIEDAIHAKSFQGETHTLLKGDVERALQDSEHVFEGDMKIGGQEHFYLETQNSLVIPQEGHEYIVHASTQNPAKTLDYLSWVLGIPQHRFVCKVKRMGGGFGGKETRSLHITALAAVPAYHLQRPVRLCLERDVDFINSGARHPFYARYKVGVSKEGKLNALDIELYNNGGYSFDLSGPVLDRALLHVDNCYEWPNFRAVGRVCLTNLPSNTAFRGFGGPQGMLITEAVMDRISRELNIPQVELRERNFYQTNAVLPTGQQLEDFDHLLSSWRELKNKIEFEKTMKEIADFNAQHRYRKRGLGILPTKFGIAFTATFLNQGGALVHIYKDGSVLVSHGGTEMGQGLHTKMCQIAATIFNLPLSAIHITETATDKVANTSPTAASFSSDLNGEAVKDACMQIKDRLRPYFEKDKNLTWAEVVRMAYFDRVDLSAHGFHKVPLVHMSWEGKGHGRPFRYFTYGAAASVVEVDTLTGDFHILSSDVCMDIGVPLNPAIDIGQIEGAFAQGVGWTTMEELVFGGHHEHKWLPKGAMLTRGPGAYKLPGFNDVPVRFGVHLLKDAPNRNAIYSSKAVGEPPLFLGASVFFAIKDALGAARAENGLKGHFQLDSPASSERIRMAAHDEFTAPFADAQKFRAHLSC